MYASSDVNIAMMTMFFELFFTQKNVWVPKWDLNPQPSDHWWDTLVGSSPAWELNIFLSKK